jgi:hypothetical protein
MCDEDAERTGKQRFFEVVDFDHLKWQPFCGANWGPQFKKQYLAPSF